MNLGVFGVVMFMVLIAAWAFQPTIKQILQYISSKVVKGHNVLTWSAPDPSAQGAFLTFTGVEIGNYFVGVVTSREAYVATPEKPRIITEGA